MSKLDDLLQGVNVEWIVLGEVSEIIRGVRVTKKDLIENGKYPVVSGGTGYMGFVNEYNREENSITIAQYGTAGFVKWQSEKFWANDVAFTIYPINDDVLLKRYLYYFLINKQNYLYEISNKIAVPFSISKEKILKIKIPIPCPDNQEKSLEIQQEIVRILDQLTETTNNLKTELENERQIRKKQFEFYREQLFTFEEGFTEYRELRDAFNIKRGKRLVKSELSIEGNYAVFQNSMVPLGFYHQFNVKSDTTFIISAGSAGEIGYSFNDFWAADDVYYFVSTDKILNKFLYYFLLNNQFKILKKVRRSSVPRLSKTSFEKLLLPIPSLEEQERIVNLLDQFDAAHTAIEEEITKEIKLRTQQYEYYREKLLSFPSLRTT